MLARQRFDVVQFKKNLHARVKKGPSIDKLQRVEISVYKMRNLTKKGPSIDKLQRDKISV